MALDAQVALETAAVNYLRAQLGLGKAQCGRGVPDGYPPPLMGNEYVSVWSKGDSKPGSAMALDEVLGLVVTVTVRLTLPFDRAVEHLDALKARCRQVARLVGRDRYNWVVSGAANTLAGFRDAGSPDGASDAGFCEGLVWQGTDAAQERGPEWFHAHIDEGDRNCGYSQAVRFGGARLIRDFGTLDGDE